MTSRIRSAAVLLMLAACTPAGQLYEPVAPTLGEAVIVEGDTLYRVSGRGYVLLAARREAMPDLTQALDLAAVRWRGFFGAEPPAAIVLVRDSITAELDEQNLRHLGRGPLVGLTPGGSGPPRPVASGPAGPSPLPSPVRRAPAEPVAEAWVRAFADSASGTGRRRVEPARIPDWLEIGLVELVGGTGMPEVAAARLRRDPRLLSLSQLFDTPLPAAAPESAARERPRRRTLEDALNDPRERYALQSALVLQFLVERGGLTVPRELLGELAAGRGIGEALDAAGISPADPAALEEPWREWLDEVAAPGRR